MPSVPLTSPSALRSVAGHLGCWSVAPVVGCAKVRNSSLGGCAEWRVFGYALVATMLTEYVEEALRRARYELIEDEETPYYGDRKSVV